MSKTYLEMERQGKSSDELNEFAKGSLRETVKNGDLTKRSFMAGLNCGQITEEKALKDIINSIVEGK